MAAFDDLLSVQEHDSAVDRLEAQRDKLAERQELADQQTAVAELTARVGELQAERDGVEREEKRYDDSVAAIDARRAEVEEAMFSGATSNPKELQAMQAEVDQFHRQQSAIEDQEIDAMERREKLEGEIGGLQQHLDAARAAVDRLVATLAEKEGQIDAQIEEERSSRAALVPGIPDDLLELYEKIRPQNNGIGAARLVGGTCQGCHLALPAMEVDRIKKQPADALVRCEQCGCILVR